MSFTSVFGGDNIDPSYLSYAAYTIAADLTLEWALEPSDGASVMAAKMDITASAGSLAISFPDATIVSVGRDALVRNAGSNAFTVKDNAGGTLGTVASGEAWYFYLTDNATAAGTWESVQFGSGTSSASAASLAGAGLEAVSTLLQQDVETTSATGDRTLAAVDRATVALNTGGGVIYTLTSAVTLENGWFVWVINGGSGDLVLTTNGGQTIDDAATKTLAPTESVVVFSNGANFWTAAYGRSVASSTSAISIIVTGEPSPLTLNATQVAANVQDYTGILGVDLVVNYGVLVGYWFVYNNTTGAHTLTFRVNGADPGVAVAQGSYSVIRSNGSTMSIAFTATTGTVTSVATTAELTGGPITTTGTLDLSNSGATAGTYGSATRTVTATVTGKGRLTALSDQLIAIPISQVDVMTSAALAARVSDETGTGVLVFATGPTLSNPVVGTQAVGNNTTLGASTAFVTAAVALAAGRVYQQVFVANGTYTPHAGMINCIIECVAGGGGGGGITGDVGWVSEAAGGGAGSYSRLLATAATIGASQAVTIGALGAGGTAGNNNGAAGTDTSVGVLCVAKGGSGGQYTDAGVQVGTGGAGGVAGTGDLAMVGQPGGSGYVLSSTQSTARGAPGGSSFFGGGGGQTVVTALNTATAGAAASNYGSGGGGAASLDTALTAAGGDGTAGIVIITEFCNQ